MEVLKNKDDIEMCQGIYDYDVLMSMLEDKYAHADMIIPKMLQKLKNLPNGTSNEIMLKNISIIINIYEQNIVILTNIFTNMCKRIHSKNHKDS